MGDASAPSDPMVAIVVVDLDGLYGGLEVALAALQAWGLAQATALLLVSAYPLDLEILERRRLLDGLQPPFSPQEFAARVRRLLRRSVLARPGRRCRAEPTEGAELAG